VNEASDCSRSLQSREAIALRKEMLRDKHIAQFTDFVDKLRRAHRDWEFPDFDPHDGGANADMLFLFEKPGRMTSAGSGKGSGFISRDNDDPTANAIFDFMKKANLCRDRTVIWNVIPGWNGTRKIVKAELSAGVDSLRGLLPLLPKLRTVILVGKKAQRAKPLVEPLGFRIFVSAHPSPLVRASRPDVWHNIPLIWAQAGMLDRPPGPYD
jgi:hypothetical protein